MTRSGSWLGGGTGSDSCIPRAVRTNSQMTIKVGPMVQRSSNFRLPKCGGGSPEPGRCRKRIKPMATMPLTISRMIAQTTSTKMNKWEIASVCAEAGSKTGM